MISHIGGHAFAGNVIVYIPPSYQIRDLEHGDEGKRRVSPLAGTGIWYGRVQPRHVEGILAETVEKGRVIGPLWRGGLERVKIDGLANGEAVRGQIMQIP